MNHLSLVAGMALIGFSILIGAMSLKLTVGTPSNMGPGFIPLVACILLFCFCSVDLVLGLKTPAETEKQAPENRSLVKPIGLMLIVLAYMLLLDVLGYLVMAFVVVFAMCSLSAGRRWAVNAAFAGVVAVVSYALFNWLGVGLPPGLLRIGW
jgi:putative tricarboxylic transport membrane protein